MSNSKFKFLRQITAPMIEGVVIIDSTGKIQSANSAVSDMFGYDEAELIGENVKILMPAEYAEHHDSYIERYNRTKRPKILDVGRDAEGRNRDGTTFPVNLKVEEIDFEGTPYYMGVIHNLQRQYIASEQLKYHTELLERAESIAHLGHWRVDLIKNTLFWSKEIYRIHGVEPNEYTPEVESAINFYHPDEREMVSEFLQQAIESDDSFLFEARIIRKDGQIVHVRSSGECTRDKSGNAISIFGVFLDITQIKKTETALIRANEELEEFAYRTSHDLRSPLISSAKLLAIATSELKKNNTTHAIQCLGLVESSLEDLNILVKDILTLTKAQKQDETCEIVDIKGFIDDSLNKMSHIENFDQLDIDIDVKQAPTLETQPNRFKLIIENLVSNAIKYQDPNTETPFIHIQTQLENSEFHLKIRDNGLGIPDEFHDKLFSMFTRFHSRVAYGSGLGLYMVKKSVEILGGSIEFIPQTRGSCFRVSLPIDQNRKD